MCIRDSVRHGLWNHSKAAGKWFGGFWFDRLRFDGFVHRINEENMRQIERQPRTDGENKMGVMPVNRLLVTMALPIMISMIIQAMYNIVAVSYTHL